jgi:hypothetical protein
VVALDLRRRVGQSVGAGPREDEVRAGGGERIGDPATDWGARARDDGGLVVEVLDGIPFAGFLCV